MPIKMLSENHRSAELQAELVFPVSAVSIGLSITASSYFFFA